MSVTPPLLDVRSEPCYGWSAYLWPQRNGEVYPRSCSPQRIATDRESEGEILTDHGTIVCGIDFSFLFTINRQQYHAATAHHALVGFLVETQSHV